MDIKLSKNLKLSEAIYSITAVRLGIDNNPNQDVLRNMVFTAINIFEPLYTKFSDQLKITSFYRCEKLNNILPGSSKKSQHLLGKAIDLELINIFDQHLLYEFILNNITFDELIWEYGTDINPSWVHVSYNVLGNRHQILKTG